jgi:membrane-associated protein
MIIAITPLLYTLGPVAVLLVMAVVFAETGLLLGFLPGDSLLFTAGVLVAAHVVNVPLWVLALGVVTAAAIGDQVGYQIGRRLGPRIRKRPDSRLFSRRQAALAEEFFAVHGSKAIVLARFVPVLRAIVPVVAGVGRMPRNRFTAYNLTGAFLWGVGFVAAGFVFGGIPFVAQHVDLIMVGVVAITLGSAAAALLRRRNAARNSATLVDAVPDPGGTSIGIPADHNQRDSRIPILRK